MRSIRLTLLSILAVLALAGCASMPLKTVYNLWTFDPWSSDFRNWRAAVRLPEERGVPLERARVQMKVETWREGDPARQTEVFVLERIGDAAALAPLAAEARKGYVLAAYRFAPADHARLDALRTRIVSARTSGNPVKGQLSISASACGADLTPPDGKLLLSTYLLVDPKDGYNPLAVDFDIAPELRKSAAKGEPSPLCRGAG